MRLEHKTAVITGAGVEFGRVIARAYAREGADLLLHEWPESGAKLADLQAEIRALGRRAEVGLFDISTAAGAAALTADAMRHFGKIDILVNATQANAHGAFFAIGEAQWRTVLDRGVTAYFLMCQHAGKEMARRGYGKIINITSIVGRIGAGGAVPWGADRGAIDSMTAAVAQALGQYGVNVIALARGATDSAGYLYTEEAKAERLLRLPFGRLGREDDIVGPAIFFATDEAGWIHGSVVYVDGGYVTAAATDREFRATEVPYRGP